MRLVNIAGIQNGGKLKFPDSDEPISPVGPLSQVTPPDLYSRIGVLAKLI